MADMHSRFLLSFKRSWSEMLNLGFGLLCLRFLFAVGQSSNEVLVLLAVASFALGWWRPAASLFALILSFSLVSGLERTVLHVPNSAVLTIASALWLGLIVRKLLPFPPAECICLEPAESPNRTTVWMMLIIEILATIALFALCLQTWRQNTTPDFWTRFWHQAHYGPGDPAYFLTSGFLWLHGLFYFRAVREHSSAGILSLVHIKLALLVNGGALLLFHGVQWQFDFPARWNPGFETPFEDIATFGIMAACLLIISLALIRRGHARWLLVLGPGAVLLAIAVGASWSRGTWLATATSLCALALVRLPRPLAVLFLSSVLGLVVFLNVKTREASPMNRPYLTRLISLVRVEDPRIKISDRASLHLKALAMVSERPWTGHGIGSFYLRAPCYARPEDPSAGLLQLPHNLLLQLAAEQGAPVALLFLGFVGWSIWRGSRGWIVQKRRGAIVKGDSREPSDPLAHLILGLTLALAAYLQANMTWDILLIHPTQPFFFWFLLAALWASVEQAGLDSPPLP